VCKNPVSHAGLARRGKTSTGWFYLTVNDRGELCTYPWQCFSRLARRLFFGDKGYLSNEMNSFKVQLISANMMLPLLDKLLLRRRVIVR
jgi:CRP-like cAMP-binding protein